MLCPHASAPAGYPAGFNISIPHGLHHSKNILNETLRMTKKYTIYVCFSTVWSHNESNFKKYVFINSFVCNLLTVQQHFRSYYHEFKSRKKKPHFTPGTSICIWIINWNEEKCVTPALLLDLRLLMCLQVWELQESSTIAQDAYSYQLQGCNWKMILIMD